MFRKAKKLFCTVTRWLQNARSRVRCVSKRPCVRPTLEALEDRLVPATIGVDKTAVLDFNGAALTATQLEQGGWSGYRGRTLSSFSTLFNSSRPWLDMNGNGVVNSDDAALAINTIVNKVSADFAPYRLKVVAGDFDTTYRTTLTDTTKGDAVVIITGGGDFMNGYFDGRTPFHSTADWRSLKNAQDEIVFTFAGQNIGSWSNRDQWLNNMARVISHELGHAFGLHHEVISVESERSAAKHSIMNEVDRDYTRDFGFQDISYRREDGLRQNAHGHLLREDILGAANKVWMQVLKPGELTISGNHLGNTISVNSAMSGTQWTITVDGVTTVVDLAGTNVNSLNPFSAPLSKILIYGKDGNDTIVVDRSITVATRLDGGSGSDTLFGGNGADELLGGDGYYTDWLYGRGGIDTLSGGAGDDFLDGGYDGLRDTLTGGGGKDTFARHYARDFRFVYTTSNPGTLEYYWALEEDTTDYFSGYDKWSDVYHTLPYSPR